MAKIRAAGYPTPEWLAVGTAASGFGYQIQDFVPGCSPSELAVREARMLVDVLETHAGLDPDLQRCWTQYVTATMADEHEEVCRRATPQRFDVDDTADAIRVDEDVAGAEVPVDQVADRQGDRAVGPGSSTTRRS